MKSNGHTNSLHIPVPCRISWCTQFPQNSFLAKSKGKCKVLVLLYNNKIHYMYLKFKLYALLLFHSYHVHAPLQHSKPFLFHEGQNLWYNGKYMLLHISYEVLPMPKCENDKDCRNGYLKIACSHKSCWAINLNADLPIQQHN